MAHNKFLRMVALLAAGVVVIWVLYGGRIRAAWQGSPASAGFALGGVEHDPANTPVQSSPAPGSVERKILYWYDPMHPKYKADKPGKAPDCGMDLVPKYADDPPMAATPASGGERKVLYWYDAMNPQRHYDKPGKASDGMDLLPQYAEVQSAPMAPGSVMISADKQQLIGVRTAQVKRETLMRDVRTTGQITTDETKIAHVHVKVNGFIENVYVDYIGQLVKKGQPLFTWYSPDLLSTQEEYLIAKRGEKTLGTSEFAEVAQGSESLLRSARQRLKLWDISDEQIKKLDETGEVSRTLTFYSPISGFVTDRKAFPQTSVNPDTELYTVSDLSTVWVNADVFEYEVPFVKLGQHAEMQLSYYPGKSWNGRVSFIYPTADATTHTVKVRLEFPNPGFQLKPQMFADVQLKINYGNQILVPQEAVLDSGKEQSVFVAHDGGYFEPRKITTGAKLDGKIVVLAGLKPGETIVTSGNFLIDSESQLKGATGAMQHQ